MSDVGVGRELPDHPGRYSSAFSNNGEEDVLGPDVVVPEGQRLAQGQLHDLLGPGREAGTGEASTLSGHRSLQRAGPEGVLGGPAHRLDVDADGSQGIAVEGDADDGSDHGSDPPIGHARSLQRLVRDAVAEP